MNILALDTAMQACSAALLRDASGASEIFSRYEDRERGHAEAIIPMLNEVMSEAGLDYDELDRIGVTVGPGTFTGVRVGVAAARGLALATGAGVTGITSLAVIARAVIDERDSDDAIVAVAADARRGQVYFAMFDASCRALCDHMAIAPCNAARLLPASGACVLAGSGAEIVAAAAGQRHAPETIIATLQPDAATLARMALAREADPHPVSPLYLRAPDAKPQTGHAIARL